MHSFDWKKEHMLGQVKQQALKKFLFSCRELRARGNYQEEEEEDAMEEMKRKKLRGQVKLLEKYILQIFYHFF